MEDHYKVLQVRRDAEPEVIEKAYKALSLKYHPDVAQPAERQRATRRMQRINAAYSVLSDPAARVRYDDALAPEHPERSDSDAWDVFLERGLVGMFWAWYSARH